MCGMPRPSFVCDPEFILTRGDAEKLDQIATEFRKSTSCICPKCTDDIGVSLGIFIRHNVSKEVMMNIHGSSSQHLQKTMSSWMILRFITSTTKY
ncbi:uncharacterized protein TNCT_412111, partial [Trichonephila clavata]